MAAHLELLDEETLGVQFPYDAGVVARLKTLRLRRWNPKHGRWEVHLSHLGDVMRILQLARADVPREIIARYRVDWARQKVKVRLGAVEGKLGGAGLPLKAIDDETSYLVPGHEYSDKFLSKKWDGKRHLFSMKTLTFPAGLWPRIRAVLEREQVKYGLEHEDGVAPSHAIAEANELGIANADDGQARLRPYQLQAIEDALRAGRGIIQIATGGGKTLTAAHLIRRIGRRTLFFVHTLDLLYQAAGVFERELGIEVGILGDGQAKLRPLTVATVQTAARAYDAAAMRAIRKRTELEEDEGGREERVLELDEATRHEVNEAIARAGVVIFDECHHVPADTFYKIAMKTRGAAWRFGLSATPWRDDHNDMLLEAALGPKLSIVNCSDLIEQGYLIPPTIRIKRSASVRLVRRGLRYHDCYQAAIVENRERNRLIAARAREWAQAGRSVLILLAHVAHGEILQEMLPEALFVHGSLETELRQRYLKELEQKLHRIMIATTLADEGLDLPSLDAVILAGGGKSQTRAYQRLGRALRPAPGKREALILDFLDEAPWLREHSQARLELYRQERRFAIELE